MLPAIDIIADRRRKLGLTQSRLAGMAEVSQSYIAKLEAGKIEPSYLKVKAIFKALDQLERKEEITAREVMTPEVISVQRKATVHETIEIMRRNGYSQIPVMNGDNPVGGITERTLLDQILYSDDGISPSRKLVGNIMDECWPIVADDAPISLLSNLLKYYQAILVQKKGQIIGIITKADLLSTFK